MPRGQKTQLQTSAAGAPKAKRAKVEVDPVQEKITVVCHALSNKEYEVPGPESCRAMLCAAAPAALRTLQSERHDYQEVLLGMIDEVFESAEVMFQRRSAEAQAAQDTSQAKHEAHEAAKAAAVEAVTAKKSEITEKQQVVAQNASSVRDVEKKLREAEEDRRSAEAAWQALGVEQERCQELIQGSFQVLKDGSWETVRVQKQNLAAVKAYAQKNLSQDKSVLDSMATVFSKKSEERGTFDTMVVDQLCNSLAKHLEALGEQRSGASAAMEEKAATVNQVGDMVKTAKENKQASEDVVAAAEAELSELAARLAEAQKAVKDNEKAAKQAFTDLACQKSNLERLQGERQAFAFLQARTVIPEPSGADENMAESEAVVPEASKTVVDLGKSEVSKVVEAPLVNTSGTMVVAGA